MITRRSAELGMAGFTALFGVVAIVGALEYGVAWSSSGPEPGAFPFYIGIIIVVASLGNIAGALFAGNRMAAQPFVSVAQLRLVLGFTLPILGLVIASLLLGLYVGMALYMFGTLVFQNRYPVAKAALIALAMPICIYLLIEKAFRVSMLKGPLEALIGL